MNNTMGNKQHILATTALCILSLISLNAQQEPQKYDYIASGYYQLVYEADIAHWEGNDNLAFAKLQEAEKRCPLINMPTYNEMELYCRLLMKDRQYEKALAYMDTLANQYGKFSSNVLIDIGQDTALLKNLLRTIPDFYLSKIPKLLRNSELYYASLQRDSIINVLIDMCANDQNVRQKNLRTMSLEDREKMKAIDISNYNRLFELINKFGFPNLKMYGTANIALHGRLGDLFSHITDHVNITDTILQFVRGGQCTPNLYGKLLDRKDLFKYLIERGRPMYLYAVFINLRDDEIIDIEHLDERRIAIGMPTREMAFKRSKLIREQYYGK